MSTPGRNESTMVADLRHQTAQWDAGPTRVVAGALLRAPMYPAIKALIFYRLASWCWHHRLRVVALWFKSRSIRVTGAEIHPAARFGPGLALVHSTGIVVGHEVVAGRDLVLYHGVTLGHNGRGQGQPHIGDGVRVGAGATVLGPIAIGDGARIGANAVVLADVPIGATVVGIWKHQP
jgi:serine O-acetyltransferase